MSGVQTGILLVVEDPGTPSVELEVYLLPESLALLPGTLAGRQVVLVIADPTLTEYAVATVRDAIRARGAASVTVTGTATP